MRYGNSLVGLYYVKCFYWLLLICVRHGKFHSWCPFLPLVILFWLLFSSNISSTSIQVKLLNTFSSKGVSDAGISRYISVNTCHGVDLDFVIKSLYMHFLNVCSQCLWCSPFSVCCKIIFSVTTFFHQIFFNYPCTHMDILIFPTWGRIC